MFRRLLPGVLGLFLLALASCDAGDTSKTTGGSGSGTPTALRGCTVGTPPPVAPGGYYTNGTTVCTADGTPHLFHGVARPSLEWGAGEHINAEDFQGMADWHANVVRVALNQDFWLSGAALYNPEYAATVDKVVTYAEAAGLDVIFDLHWSDRGDLSVTVLNGQDKNGTSNQQQMADANSVQFWKELAMKYQNDGHVMFELYNEPNGVSWSVWLKGGPAAGFTVAGMQELYDTVRATGANNIVIAGGLGYAFDLSGVAAGPIKGYNIMYASHPYKPQDPASAWQSMFGYLATNDVAPVILTEFGDTGSKCTGDWDTQLIKFADAAHISWTAWAWYSADPCNFPALISDWDNHTPTVQGVAVKAALMAYPYVPPANVGAGGQGGASEGGASGASSSEGGAGGVSIGGASSSEGGAGGATSSEGGATSADAGAGGASGASSAIQ
jgi:endoglucanase